MSLGMTANRPKLLSTSGTMSSTASTASSDSLCQSGSESPRSSRSVETQDAFPKEGALRLPLSYLPGWCVKNTFVDFEPCDQSTRRRRASAPSTLGSAEQIALEPCGLEDLRQQVCSTAAMEASSMASVAKGSQAQGGLPATGLAPATDVVPVDLSVFPSIGSVGHYTRQCTP
eukprot:6472232-Amphidinium_carterae.2